ncbi:hypothetical protein [Anaerorhabdus furcosa]|uniref:Membrane protein 6-pyruvoyl-tetrahydropterin synthase-related domain-containing protein n=1 Tax=Anaerorhabdus furcosa TaxID=118967 RepID=A0A1T4LPB2_9FIRM|nr:hypothetical protein [Anaerorhabdus furcosa]SJZ56491.1 hypothetical protein SAMN02745191_0989 [Anaerorhabdus furcosa]
MKRKLLDILIMISFCFIITLIFCYPYLNESIFIGPDTAFHMNRIEALSIAIGNNDFYPRIFFHQNYNFGYGSPMFYSFFFLYFPALLRIIGISVYDTYHIFLFVCAFLASISMYKCASLILNKNKKIYIWFTVLFYIWNCFYMSDFYKRGAVGETLAFIFIPIVIMGMYHSIHSSFKKQYILVFGFCGLLLSHNISFVIMVILYGIYLLIHIKYLLKNRKRIIWISFITIFSVLMTCFFTLPMIEQLASGSYRISDYFGTTSLVDSAMKFRDIFDFRTDESKYLCDSVGPFLLFIPLLYPFTKKKNKLITFCIIAGYIMVLMTTNLFPWQYFKFLSFLQFPTRLLIPSVCLLALSAGYTVAYAPIHKKYKAFFNKGLLIVVVLVGVLQLFGYTRTPGIITKHTKGEELSNDEQFLGSANWYNLLEVSSPDYLPIVTNVDHRMHGTVVLTNSEETITVNKPYLGYNNFTFSLPVINADTYYVAPLTYYKGYAAEVYKNEQLIEKLTATSDPETGLVRIEPTVTQNDEQFVTIKVIYKGTLIQQVSGWISVISLFIYLVFTIIQQIKK